MANRWSEAPNSAHGHFVWVRMHAWNWNSVRRWCSMCRTVRLSEWELDENAHKLTLSARLPSCTNVYMANGSAFVFWPSPYAQPTHATQKKKCTIINSYRCCSTQKRAAFASRCLGVHRGRNQRSGDARTKVEILYSEQANRFSHSFRGKSENCALPHSIYSPFIRWRFTRGKLNNYIICAICKCSSVALHLSAISRRWA